MLESQESRIAYFKKRAETEREFCEELFRDQTIRLMAHKYAYYVLNGHFVEDIPYDMEEKTWYIMGIALGLLKEDETSPCIDFDYNHPLANEGIARAKSWKLKG